VFTVVCCVPRNNPLLYVTEVARHHTCDNKENKVTLRAA
jgi:hypothetical protein